jgi:hypothetical protein
MSLTLLPNRSMFPFSAVDLHHFSYTLQPFTLLVIDK